MERIRQARGKDRWWAVVNTAMNNQYLSQKNAANKIQFMTNVTPALRCRNMQQFDICQELYLFIYLKFIMLY